MQVHFIDVCTDRYVYITGLISFCSIRNGYWVERVLDGCLVESVCVCVVVGMSICGFRYLIFGFICAVALYLSHSLSVT